MLDDDPREDDAPTGLPEGQPEELPLGVPEADPDGDHTPPGPAAMPGIPDDGEPPTAG
ncbi:MAG: hypothetical protein QOC54_3196 [Baekduia sp.]|jgi:hypothetical protein|nr:hypothetical protein [Baekduia sp.]